MYVLEKFGTWSNLHGLHSKPNPPLFSPSLATPYVVYRAGRLQVETHEYVSYAWQKQWLHFRQEPLVVQLGFSDVIFLNAILNDTVFYTTEYKYMDIG